MTQKQCNKDLKLAIQKQIYAVELEGFLCLKHGWTEATFHSIDYKANEGAFKKEDTTQKYHSSQIHKSLVCDKESPLELGGRHDSMLQTMPSRGG